MINKSAFGMLQTIDPGAARELRTELALLSPELPSTSGLELRYDIAKDGKCTGPVLELKDGPKLGSVHWQLELNCSGAIVSLNHSTAARAGSSSELVQLASVSNALAYLVVPGQLSPRIQSLWTDRGSGSVVARFLTNGTKSGPASLPLYQHWLRLDFGLDVVNITVWFGKAPDIINGASANQQAYLLFNPTVADPADWVNIHKFSRSQNVVITTFTNLPE